MRIFFILEAMPSLCHLSLFFAVAIKVTFIRLCGVAQEALATYNFTLFSLPPTQPTHISRLKGMGNERGSMLYLYAPLGMGVSLSAGKEGGNKIPFLDGQTYGIFM